MSVRMHCTSQSHLAPSTLKRVKQSLSSKPRKTPDRPSASVVVVGTMPKNKGGGKEDRRAKKAELNREREKGRRRRHVVERNDKEIASFAKVLLSEGLELQEVARDGNCFFRALCDQCEGHEHDHEKYRLRVMEHVEAHEDDFIPFFTFGEDEESEDKDFEAYIDRLKSDSEWAGQVELIAAAQALCVHIVVHQYERPSYRIDCPTHPTTKDIHLSYHDGEHYNSVRPLRKAGGKPVKPSGSSFAVLDEMPEIAEEEEEEDGGGTAPSSSSKANAAAIDGLANGIASVNLTPSAAANAPAADSDGEADGGGGERQSKASKQKDKAARKEEKRLRKEARHKEAMVAAGGVPDIEPEIAAAGETGRSVILL